MTSFPIIIISFGGIRDGDGMDEDQRNHPAPKELREAGNWARLTSMCSYSMLFNYFSYSLCAINPIFTCDVCLLPFL